MNAKQIIEMFRRATFRGRHGDVVVVRDETARGGENDPTRTLAEGEATGHAHRVDRGEIRRVTEAVTQRILALGEAALLDHEEHKAQEIPIGTHRSAVQAQWTPEGLRRVQD